MQTKEQPTSNTDQNNASAGKSLPLVNLILLLNRIAIGWYFAVAGWTKTMGELNEGVGSFYRGGGFQERNPSWLPDFIAAPYGYALPWLELVFGALLIVGFFSRFSAAVIVFLSLTIGIALLGAGELLPRHHVMVFFAASLPLLFWGAGRYSLDAATEKRGKVLILRVLSISKGKK